MVKEREKSPQDERLFRMEAFAHSIPVISERKPLVDAVGEVISRCDSLRLIEVNRQLKMVDAEIPLKESEQELAQGRINTLEVEQFMLHNWQRDKNLSTSLLWDRFRVEFGVWAKNHPVVLKIPFVSRLPLSEIPELTDAKKFEAEAKNSFDTSQKDWILRRRQVDEEFQKPIQQAQVRLNQAERSLKDIIDRYIGSSRDMVGLYVTVFSEELEKVAKTYALNSAHKAEEINRLRSQFLALINEQVQDKNQRLRAAKLYGQWKFDPKKQDLPLENPQAHEFWEAFVAYDVVRSCYEADPSKFAHQPTPPKVI